MIKEVLWAMGNDIDLPCRNDARIFRSGRNRKEICVDN